MLDCLGFQRGVTDVAMGWSHATAFLFQVPLSFRKLKGKRKLKVVARWSVNVCCIGKRSRSSFRGTPSISRDVICMQSYTGEFATCSTIFSLYCTRRPLVRPLAFLTMCRQCCKLLNTELCLLQFEYNWWPTSSESEQLRSINNSSAKTSNPTHLYSLFHPLFQSVKGPWRIITR